MLISGCWSWDAGLGMLLSVRLAPARDYALVPGNPPESPDLDSGSGFGTGSASGSGSGFGTGSGSGTGSGFGSGSGSGTGTDTGTMPYSNSPR
ncbi:hypothetical protein PSCLAVI8L_410008 [Pseudoclavibacter sp. 8L]|nr:hypothetical protein PSCLAVI8L_410008 [Pseudoclavibacter sp. 8L]